MHGAKMLTAALAAGSLALGAGQALASKQAAQPAEVSKPSVRQPERTSEVRRIRGEVTAVMPDVKTMVVRGMEGKKALTVGVDVTEKTIIREGKAAKTLADIKAGDRVWLKYDRLTDKLVAEQIRILKPANVAAKTKRY